jgi:hypothetical protein
MMMFGDRKKAISTILSRRHEDGSTSEAEAKPEKSFDPKMEAHRAIAEDLHHAIENKSVDGIASALKAHHDLIKAGTGDVEETAEVEK